jgi:glutamate-ammonia-ligase adenylyltransferase
LQYYTRLTQRLVSALTVATRRGRLYEVDLRLRPSGGKGPLATQWKSFVDYQLTEAEVWEHMSLTRARPIAGDESLRADFEKGAGAVIGHQREPVALRKAVADMRALIAQEKGDSQIWDLKLVRGGMMDIEFIAQYLALNHAHERPGMIQVETAEILRVAVRDGLLDPEQAERLISAHRLYTILMQMFRLSTEGAFDPAQMATGVLRRIAAAADLPDFRLLESNLSETRAQVRGNFEKILGKI